MQAPALGRVQDAIGDRHRHNLHRQRMSRHRCRSGMDRRRADASSSSPSSSVSWSRGKRSLISLRGRRRSSTEARSATFSRKVRVTELRRQLRLDRHAHRRRRRWSSRASAPMSMCVSAIHASPRDDARPRWFATAWNRALRLESDNGLPGPAPVIRLVDASRASAESCRTPRVRSGSQPRSWNSTSSVALLRRARSKTFATSSIHPPMTLTTKLAVERAFL